MDIKKQKNKNEFICGFACALIILNEIYDKPIKCVNAIKSAGFTKEDFKCVDRGDRYKLIKILRGLN